MKLWIILVLFIAPFQIQSSLAAKCGKDTLWIEAFKLEEKIFPDLPEYYERRLAYGPAAEDMLFAIGYVDPKTRGVRMHFKTKDPKERRVRGFQGSKEFDAILDRFQGRFTHLVGLWQLGSDNLQEFNAALQKTPRPTIEEAALQTWTGKQAVRHGYTQVKVEIANKIGDAYDVVKVTYWKPPTVGEAPKAERWIKDFRVEESIKDDTYRREYWYGPRIKNKQQSLYVQGLYDSNERALYLDFKTRDKDGYRIEGLQGEKEFDQILSRFDGKVDHIIGEWVNEDSENLRQFRLLLNANGRNLIEAAANTWTGKQAARHGYTKIVFVTLKPWSGDPTTVRVRFSKPGR